jgi:hypothetical protein
LNYLDENQLAKRIERNLASRRRKSSVLNFVLCAVVLILGIALIVSIMARWFIIF